MNKKRGFILAEAAAASLVAGIFLMAVCSSLSVSALLVKRHSEKVRVERLKREIMVDLAVRNTDTAPGVDLPAGEGWRQVFKSLKEITGEPGKGSAAIVWPNNQ